MYQGLLHLHNFGRWVVIILLIGAIINAVTGVSSGRPYGNKDKKTALFLMISAHLMFVIGLYQWIAGPWGLQNIQELGMPSVMKNSVMRFWAVEHFAGMFIGIALITIGKGVGRKPITDLAKHKRSLLLFVIALIAILISVPWPFREVGRPLFPGVSM